MCPVGSATPPVKSEVELELGCGADEASSEVVVERIDVRLGTRIGEEGGTDEGASSEEEDSITADGSGTTDGSGDGDEPSDAGSAELLDGGAILVGGGATLDDGRTVLKGGAALEDGRGSGLLLGASGGEGGELLRTGIALEEGGGGGLLEAGGGGGGGELGGVALITGAALVDCSTNCAVGLRTVVVVRAATVLR
jgi:hypothetical protein